MIRVANADYWGQGHGQWEQVITEQGMAELSESGFAGYSRLTGFVKIMSSL